MKPEQVQKKIQISRATFFRLVSSGNLLGAKKMATNQLVLLEETLMELEKASPDSSEEKSEIISRIKETQKKLDELTGEEHSRSTGTEINGNQSASDSK